MANIHVARISIMQVDNIGNIVDKNTSTIGQQLRTQMSHRIITDAGIPNSAGNPDVKTYLEAEAADNYILNYMDQNMIVTYEQA